MSISSIVNLPDKIRKRISLEENSGCWIWIGAKRNDGYGLIWDAKKDCWIRAHRFVFQFLKEKIPEGKQLDHRICRNKSCVNPEHQVVCTAQENREQPDNIIGMRMRQTHCKRGHELFGDNLHVDTNGARQCKSCRRMRETSYRRAA